MRRAHNAAEIRFIKERFAAAVRKEEMEFWQKVLAEAQKARGASLRSSTSVEQLLHGRKELRIKSFQEKGPNIF